MILPIKIFELSKNTLITSIGFTFFEPDKTVKDKFKLNLSNEQSQDSLIKHKIKLFLELKKIN